MKICDGMQREAEVRAGKPVGSSLSTTFTPMSDNWITDRVPTESDADPDGEVITRRGLDPEDWVHIHWSLIKPGNPWRHSNNLNPPAQAAELSLSDFKVWQVWRTRKGKMCRIISITVPPNDNYPIQSDLYGSHWHSKNGRSIPGGNLKDYEDDLIELISEELVEEAPEPAPERPAATEPPLQPAQPAAKPSAAEIPELIRSGAAPFAAPFYLLIVSDDSGRGSSLQAVLQYQSRIGSRYGTTHIAECRIIPELTREVPANV